MKRKYFKGDEEAVFDSLHQTLLELKDKPDLTEHEVRTLSLVSASLLHMREVLILREEKAEEYARDAALEEQEQGEDEDE